jgi:hypothetical protein
LWNNEVYDTVHAQAAEAILRAVDAPEEVVQIGKVMADTAPSFGAAVLNPAGFARPNPLTVRVFRGVNESNIAYERAAEGIVKPNKQWWQVWKQGATPLEHNAIRGATIESPYTSWTTDQAVAENFALRPTGQGVVVTADVPVSRLVASPNLKTVVLRQSGAQVSESEVLIRGTVRGEARLLRD